jgi:hypothetical protein
MGPSRLLSYVVFSFVLAATFIPRAANAQGARPITVHVLEIDSEDASDQAEALTGALRSRVRATPGWTVLETTQSLSMLTAALRCPPHPDPQCLQRIGDQLKADHFIWGVMSKNAQHEVVAEVHLWSRGKPDRAAKENYNENLKDQNDDSLRRIASQIFERIGGGGPGTLVVTAGTEDGAVFVDGEQRAQLDHGHATLEVPAGTHTIEVRGPNVASKQTVNLASSATTELNFPVQAGVLPSTPPVPEPSKPFPTRAVLGWTTVIAGVALLTVGALEFKGYLDAVNSSDPNGYLKAYKGALPNTMSVHQACASNYQPSPLPAGFPMDSNFACGLDKSAVQDSALTAVFGGLGAVALGTGVYLLLSGKHTEETPATPQPQVRLVPQLSPFGGALGLQGTF